MMVGERITRFGYEYDKLVRGYHAAAAALLATKNRLILDNATIKLSWKTDLQARLESYNVIWIGVVCADWRLDEREEARGDRALALPNESRKSFTRI